MTPSDQPQMTTCRVARVVTISMPPEITEDALCTLVESRYGQLDSRDAGDAIGMLEMHAEDSPWVMPDGGIISLVMDYDRFDWSRPIR